MKRKRILSGLLTICLMLSAISIPVFGAEEDSKGLEQAITKAKSIITVPENYNDFTHDSSERKTSNGKVRVWRLEWTEKEGKNGYVSASIGEDGFLYDYNKWSDDENKNDLAKVTKNKAQLIAESFLEKVIPERSKQMKIINDNSNSHSGEDYRFTYQKFVNDIPVNFVISNIGVNKYSGEVNYYHGGNPEIHSLEYPSLDGVINQADAEKAYIEKLGVDLKYYSYYDYNQKKMNIFAGYSIDKNENNAISAKTGQVVSGYNGDRFTDDKAGYDGMGAGSAKSAGAFSPQLTKEETDEIKNVSNLISKEKAESILRETSDIIPANAKVINEYLNKSYTNDGYTWRISFEGGSGEVNAESGEVISLRCNKKDTIENKNISKEEARNIAENFLKKISPNKFEQTVYKDNEDTNLKDKVTSQDNNFSFRFTRQVKGIEFSNNSLRVEINGANGKITAYSNRWNDDASFPDISQVMIKEAAFNKIKELSSFSLQFVMLDKNKIELVYNFKNRSDYIIDPVSGIRLDYTGKPYKENKLPEYTDINGHWCEGTVKELLDNGYYIDGDKFNPNLSITQVNFLKYLYSAGRESYATDDEFYNMLIKTGIVKKEEKSPSSLVSNQEAAKFIIRYLGYAKIAVNSEIFNNPFKDNVEEEYKGYAAMCYSLNIIKGVNGNFYGTHCINNAEAATIIYNLIKNNTK